MLELWVVTGEGQLKQCSASQNPGLFNAVRGGLGQFGVIVKARVKLIAVKPLARHYTAVYADVATLIADQVKLMNEGRFDYVEGLGLPQPDDSYVLLLEAVKYFSDDAPPDDAAMLAGLAFIPGTSAADTQTLYDFYNRLAPIVDFTKFTGDWLESDYPGFTNGRRWNGWAMPLVTRETLDALIAIMGPANAEMGDEDVAGVAGIVGDGEDQFAMAVVLRHRIAAAVVDAARDLAVLELERRIPVEVFKHRIFAAHPALDAIVVPAVPCVVTDV